MNWLKWMFFAIVVFLKKEFVYLPSTLVLLLQILFSFWKELFYFRKESDLEKSSWRPADFLVFVITYHQKSCLLISSR